MIYIGFAIRNPFKNRFKPLKTWVIPLTKNKTIEAGFYKTSGIIGGAFGITSMYQDHKGFSFDIELLGYQFDFNFYDNRHHEDYQ